MAAQQKDTEITLGTGWMLAIFFALVLICAVFFSLGFSLGKRTSAAVGSTLQNLPNSSSTPVARPTPTKNNGSSLATHSDESRSGGSKGGDSGIATRSSKAQPSNSSSTESSPKSSAGSLIPLPSSGGTYYVQVAAVTRQEDAESLVEALKKKQYPAAAINNPAGDKYFHVQVGPYADLKDAETMKQRLVGDGYNPIVKK